MHTLLLWDIDGTLIDTGGAGRRALEEALQTAFGLPGSLADIEFAGRTDPWIMRAIFRKFALEESPANFAHYFAHYTAALPGALATPRARVLPGVREILVAAAEARTVAQGLLTGNMLASARLKLSQLGLWEFFAFGAYGDDSEERDGLGPHALRRALERHGVNFPARQVWVIGDTPHDIACGRKIGARTLAVGTGGCALDELRRHHPTAVLPDLQDTRAVLELLVS